MQWEGISMATTGELPKQTVDAALMDLLHQMPEAMEATDLWREVIEWAEGIYEATGRPATLDDLYRDLHNLRLSESFGYEERAAIPSQPTG